jgi:hypothetical protein
VTPSTAQSKSARQHAEQQWKDYELRRIEQRLDIVLATMANLKVEQARLQTEYEALLQRKEWIINPPPVPKRIRALIDEEKRLKINAYQRDYQAKRRAAGIQWQPKDRERYNKNHREYERQRREKKRAEALLTTASHVLAETRSDSWCLWRHRARPGSVPACWGELDRTEMLWSSGPA